MDLTPEYIKANFKKIGGKAARDILRQWIINSDDIDIRTRALALYSVVDDQKQFKFLEQLFISDESFKIRDIAGNILREKYFFNKNFVPLLVFSLNYVNNVDQKLFAIEQLNITDTSHSRKIIKDYIISNSKLCLSNKLNDLFNETFNLELDSSIPPKILDICFNIILYSYYVNICGFSAILRRGLITLLNCEGSELKSIDEIKGLNRLFNLEHLILQRNAIQKISGLNHLKYLETLNLSQNQINQIDNLDDLINLKELNLSSNKIKRIENLHLSRLKKLSLEKNLITDIEKLDNLEDLEHLNLSYNNISELKNLNHLIKLKSLHLSYNDILEIAGLENLKNLNTLYLNGNRISSIKGLGNLVNLRVLSLSNNLIGKVDNLEKLDKLIKLELSNNNIGSLAGLDTLQNLQELFVDKNCLTNLEGIGNLKSLIILFLENNEIKEFKLSFIEGLKNLNFIFLNQNPLNPESWDLYQKRTRYP